MREARASALVIGALLAGYLPLLGGGLLTDDFVHLARVRGTALSGLFLTPDAFGFYRPITQASLALDATLFGESEPAFRAMNLALHGGALAMAYLVTRLLSASALIAALTTVTFALTPKAPAIAVLWISARGELLMAVFSCAAVAGWVMWTRGGRLGWLVAAAAAYVLALLSKESAVLLPLLLPFVPGSTRSLAARLRGVVPFAIAAAVVLWWRSTAGAVTPFSASGQYDLSVPVRRLVRNATNYAGRLSPAPLALLLAAGLRMPRPSLHVALFGVAWTAVFLAPTLPIAARNELYLYLPAYGVSLAAAALVAEGVAAVRARRLAVTALAVLTVGLGGYQLSRAAALHADLLFSARLTTALAARSELHDTAHGSVVLTAADPATRQLLQNAVGGYLRYVLHRALGHARLQAGAQGPKVFRYACAYDGRTVTLR